MEESLNANSIFGLCFLGFLVSTTSAQRIPADLTQGAFLSMVYVNGQQNPALSLVESAKDSIDIEIYEMTDTTFLNALLEATKRGVKLRIVKDPNPVPDGDPGVSNMGCEWFNADTSHDDFRCEEQRQFLASATSSGAQIVAFNKAQLCDQDAKQPKPTCFQHGKMILVDGQRALVSTGNFNPENFCDLTQKPRVCNRDFSVMTMEQDVISTLQHVFNNDFAGQRYALEPIITGAIQNKLTVSPYSDAPLVAFIKSAKEHLQIENQYLKHPQLNRAIQAAATRGVQVEITLSSVCNSKANSSATQQLNALFKPFEQSGANVRMFAPPVMVGGRPGYMHAKVIVVDEARAWVGSVNGSVNAVDRNREFGLFVNQAEDVATLKGQLETDFNASQDWQDNVACVKRS
jgi:phosphatidylserine/phosphatidylglycerophosphate/cardiolipin synthase-like enzyme